MKTFHLREALSLMIASLIFATHNGAAHCDTLDGPVVETARAALNKGEVAPVLKWVNKENEKEIRDAFTATLKVRSLSEDARKLADTHFFETLVRVHRAGEGVPFTGLKPAGTIDPGFVAADKALSEGSSAKLSKEIAESVQEEIQNRFARVLEKKKHADESVEAGRAYVTAYVEYAHFVESLYALTSEDTHETAHEHVK